MADINTLAELVSRLQDVMAAEDPFVALKAQGHRLSPKLEQALSSFDPGRRLPLAERRRWADLVARSGPVRFVTGGTALQPVPQLAPGDYDIIAAVRMDLVDQALAGLYRTLTIPRDLPTDSAPGTVIDVLRNVFSGVPDGERIATGVLHLTAAPTALPVEGTNHVVLRVPFELDIDRAFQIFAGQVQRTKVASLKGVLRFAMLATAIVGENEGDFPRLIISLQPAAPSLNLPEEERFRVEVDPQSALQPSSESKFKSFQIVVALFLHAQLMERLPSWVVCPFIKLPSNFGVLLVRSIDVRTVQTPSGGAIVVGARIGGPEAEPGDPARLVSPFTNSTDNFYARVHTEFLRKVLKAALDSGKLAELARQQHESAVVEGADIAFFENEIHIKLAGKLVNACPFNKDLKFEATRVIRIEFREQVIVVHQETNEDLDDSDFWLFCVIGSVIQGLMVGFAVGIVTGALIGGVLGAVVGVIVALTQLQSVPFVEILTEKLIEKLKGGGGDGEDLDYISLLREVPRTELLPRLDNVFMRVGPESIEQFNRLSLVDDDHNTYVYARFIERGQIPGFGDKPLVDAEVELMDQDAPRPAGDDVTIPVDEIKVVNGDVIVTTRTEFVPPQADEGLPKNQKHKREKTDSTGHVRFVLSPQEVSTVAGSVVIHTTTENVATGSKFTVTTRRPVTEDRPDVYFRAHLPGGNVLDTRNQAEGFVLNLRSRRLGSAEAPLTFLFGGEPEVTPVPDPLRPPQPLPPPTPQLPAELKFNPKLLNFGSVSLGKSRTLKLTIANPNGPPVDISIPASSSGSRFSWAKFDGRIEKGKTKTIEVTFRPASSAFEQGKLTVKSTAQGNPHDIGLLGKGPGGFPTPTPTPTP